MFTMKMRVRQIIESENTRGARQVSLYPVVQGQHPGDMNLYIPEAEMEGIKAGATLTVTVTPDPVPVA